MKKLKNFTPYQRLIIPLAIICIVTATLLVTVIITHHYYKIPLGEQF